MLSPQEVAEKFDGIGLGKANLCVSKAILLGILAGMYIALAAVGANTGGSMMENPGVAKIISSLIFPAGLAMVVLAGSELFTGDCLMLISNLDRKITVGKMLRCWILVYVGNLIGSLVVAFLMTQAHQFSLFGNGVAMVTMKTAIAKVSLSPISAVILGIFCNSLVCVAVWIATAGTTITEKLAGVYLPIFLFVLCGFEHSVANMYYIPAGIFASMDPAYAAAAAAKGVDLSMRLHGAISLSATSFPLQSEILSAAVSWSAPFIGSAIIKRNGKSFNLTAVRAERFSKMIGYLHENIL